MTSWPVNVPRADPKSDKIESIGSVAPDPFGKEHHILCQASLFLPFWCEVAVVNGFDKV